MQFSAIYRSFDNCKMTETIIFISFDPAVFESIILSSISENEKKHEWNHTNHKRKQYGMIKYTNHKPFKNHKNNCAYKIV